MTTATNTQRSQTVRRGGSRSANRDLVPAILLGGPAIVLLIMFLIGPFFMGIGYSFTNQRLISANPTEWVGLRNYQRLLSMSFLAVDPVVDAQSGQPLLDDEGNKQYPRSRDYTRNEVDYPQYASLREWFSFDTANQRIYVLAGDPTFLRSVVNVIFFAIIVIPLQTGLGLILALLVNQN